MKGFKFLGVFMLVMLVLGLAGRFTRIPSVELRQTTGYQKCGFDGDSYNQCTSIVGEGPDYGFGVYNVVCTPGTLRPCIATSEFAVPLGERLKRSFFGEDASKIIHRE